MTEREYDQCWGRAFGPMPEKKPNYKIFFEIGFIIMCCVVGWMIK